MMQAFMHSFGCWGASTTCELSWEIFAEHFFVLWRKGRQAGRHHHALSQRTHLISRVGILPIQELCWKKPLLGGEAGIRSYHKQWCRFLGTIWRGKEGPSHVFARCLSYGVGRELDEQHNIATYYAVIKCVIKLTFTSRRSNFCQAAAALLCLSQRY